MLLNYCQASGCVPTIHGFFYVNIFQHKGLLKRAYFDDFYCARDMLTVSTVNSYLERSTIP